MESGEFVKIFKKNQNRVVENPKYMKYFHFEEKIKKIKNKNQQFPCSQTTRPPTYVPVFADSLILLVTLVLVLSNPSKNLWVS
jgi:hypothetical protein